MATYTKERIAELIQEVAPTVEKMAYMFERRGVVGSHKAIDVYDLQQAGYEAALIAIQTYDDERDAEFTTYAYRQMWRRMLSEIHNMGDSFPIPEYLHWYVIRHVASTEGRLTQELGREPTLGEIQADARLLAKLGNYRDTKKSDPLKLIERGVMYLDEGGVVSLDESEIDIEDTEAQSPEAMAELAMLKENITEALDLLPSIDRQVLERRFGFYEDPESLRDIGKDLGMSQENVRKIEKRALTTLRQHPASRSLMSNWGS